MTLECRHCGAELTTSFCDLGMSPPSNSYVQADKLDRMERFYPLHAYVCGTCFLVQLQEFESPQEIFSDTYAYFSSYSDSWLAHCRAYVEQMTTRLDLGPTSQVIELASNDGYLLQYFHQKGIPVLGIEPAGSVAEVARRNGIETLVEFFDPESASRLAARNIKADLLLGNNVLAHVPDLNGFVRAMKTALKSTGVITMEFPHLLQLMRNNQFDTIYHEHFSYLSLTTVERVFAAFGLTLFDVEELPTHGGSLRIFARHTENSALPITSNVDRVRTDEQHAGLTTLDAYRNFAEQVRATKRSLIKFLVEAREARKTVVGYGAPAKGNTLLNYCGVRSDLVDYTVDRSPHKQGTFLPGVHIPIYAPEKIAETKPDYVLILPWNLKDEVMQQMAHVRAWGGKFVVPIPSTEVLP